MCEGGSGLSYTRLDCMPNQGRHSEQISREPGGDQEETRRRPDQEGGGMMMLDLDGWAGLGEHGRKRQIEMKVRAGHGGAK